MTPTSSSHRPARRTGRKTGPKPSFTVDDVVDAALEIGIARFTLAQVAQRIGVSTSAVYRLFAGRDDLVHACLSRGATTVRWPDGDAGSWQELLRDWAEASWEVCERYPGLDEVLFTFPGAFRHIQGAARSLVDSLCGFGFTEPQALFALDFIGDTVISTHLSVSTLRNLGEDGRTGFEQIVAAAREDDAFKPHESWIGRGFLDAKLDFIIAGLEERRPEV
ncbi:TetR/AcrR family transcriptional regulator [Corynebacterium pygosceleis]|uniref:TetR/AcrR family transcriptional regulator n=1 Tax=Corynebacterium pygosceleis TaxID=2800406 RepID=A0A9Q4C8L6_9CORY|nr:TetR/AcrR family transcriptional regulator [Corynebacterium pygosceleis]MCK7637341.1 TetR/AcrR family transcriptional regulator [Corynebacterium pygosceleis]MCK7675991.1 TetR/AcrR family transcriptional regulator [Corynebacterium pygosceleis]MCL0119883.1 TetR/AcrR family transcriptional regulator [Corynebacterium pygosceleis]MCX7445244.1 TetR/AcrR family transcriptional regulator [Corynebacterium pygosceleis]MCX7468331.1 TetR/AcrR family transcriptional regulator [Corynebacterium pygoscelei